MPSKTGDRLGETESARRALNLTFERPPIVVSRDGSRIIDAHSVGAFRARHVDDLYQISEALDLGVCSIMLTLATRN